MLTTSKIEMEVLPDRVYFSWWQNHLSNGLTLEGNEGIVLEPIDDSLNLSIFNYSNGEFPENGLYKYEFVLWRNGDNWQEFVKHGAQVMLCSQ